MPSGPVRTSSIRLPRNLSKTSRRTFDTSTMADPVEPNHGQAIKHRLEGTDA